MQLLIRATCASCVLGDGSEDDIHQAYDIVHDDDSNDYNADIYGIEANDTDDDVQTVCVYFVLPSHTQKDLAKCRFYISHSPPRKKPL